MFGNEVSMAHDAAILARNNADSPTRTDSSTIGGGGLEWGSWVTLNDKDAKITPATLPFLADIFANTPRLLPSSERNGLVARQVISNRSPALAHLYTAGSLPWS